MKTIKAACLYLFASILIAGCVAKDIREADIRDRWDIDARGGFINSTILKNENGRVTQMLSRAAWQVEGAVQLNQDNIHTLSSGRAGMHSYRVITGESAQPIIDYYESNRSEIEASLEVAEMVIPEIIDWFEFPEGTRFELDIVLGLRHIPYRYEVLSRPGDSGPIRIAITDTPFFDKPRDLTAGVFAVFIHEAAHVKYGLKYAHENTLFSRRFDNRATYINEETAAKVLENCTLHKIFRKYAELGMSRDDLVLNTDFDFLDELFPGWDNGEFAPESEKIEAISPINLAWARTASVILLLLIEDEILNVQDDSDDESFNSYCPAIAKEIPDYLGGQMWPQSQP